MYKWTDFAAWKFGTYCLILCVDKLTENNNRLANNTRIAWEHVKSPIC